MDKETQIISIRENAKAELTNLKSIEDGMVHLNKLKGIEAWVKAQKLDAEIHALVMEQELRTKRIVGVLLKEGRESGDIVKVGQNKIHHETKKRLDVVDGDNQKKTLKDLGLTNDQSSTFQKLASIPEKIFEEHIAEAKAEVETAVNKLTTTGALKLAESLDEKKTVLKNSKIIQEKTELEEKVKELLSVINAMPKLYRLKVKQGIK